MSEWRKFAGIVKEKKFISTLVLILTFVLTVVFDLVVAIAAGLVIYYLFVLVNYIKNKMAAGAKA